MFTGLVQFVGVVAEAKPSAAGVSLGIDAHPWGHVPSRGDSICVNGVCLTLASEPAEGPRCWRFDAVRETLSKTTLGSLRAGLRVNLEHALRASDLVGGHFVQGHVDGVGVVARVQNDPADWRVEFEIPQPLRAYLSSKGSIAIDGVSLTIARVTPNGVEVALIPTTLEKTTLGGLKAGDTVNVETDMMAKMVVGFLRGSRALHADIG